MFAFLFGLSMDYEVFLLARIREEHDISRDTDRAAVTGVSRTGRLVTSGALILFLAFVSLSRVPVVDVKILATGLALSIVLDATPVRGVLAPALAAALGRAQLVVAAPGGTPAVPRRVRRYAEEDNLNMAVTADPRVLGATVTWSARSCTSHKPCPGVSGHGHA